MEEEGGKGAEEEMKDDMCEGRGRDRAEWQ